MKTNLCMICEHRVEKGGKAYCDFWGCELTGWVGKCEGFVLDEDEERTKKRNTEIRSKIVKWKAEEKKEKEKREGKDSDEMFNGKRWRHGRQKTIYRFTRKEIAMVLELTPQQVRERDLTTLVKVCEAYYHRRTKGRIAWARKYKGLAKKVKKTEKIKEIINSWDKDGR